MPRVVQLSESSPLKFDPNLPADAVPPAPNVRPWPRKADGTFEVLKVCRCGISKTFPLCDGSHKACKDEDPRHEYAYDRLTGSRTDHGPTDIGI